MGRVCKRRAQGLTLLQARRWPTIDANQTLLWYARIGKTLSTSRKENLYSRHCAIEVATPSIGSALAAAELNLNSFRHAYPTLSLTRLSIQIDLTSLYAHQHCKRASPPSCRSNVSASSTMSRTALSYGTSMAPPVLHAHQRRHVEGAHYPIVILSA